jgi:DNA-binding CsgD family transcriptional regulator
MSAMPAQQRLGERLGQVFRGAAPKLERAFRLVLKTGNSLSNLELTALLDAGTEPRRWVVSCHPVIDKLGQILLVAAIFSEITKGRCVELNLWRLRDKIRSKLKGQPDVLEEEHSAMSARTLELVNRSVELLKDSLLLRFYASEMRLEAGLVRHALFLSANRVEESSLLATSPPTDSSPDRLPSPSPQTESVLPGGCPSPRERQVLRFLADGKSNKEIGSILDISTRTVECYRARIMLKLDLHSTAALVRYAIRNNIVEA